LLYSRTTNLSQENGKKEGNKDSNSGYLRTVSLDDQ
jgi:hypothetical protein